jgi:hypothetical protein
MGEDEQLPLQPPTAAAAGSGRCLSAGWQNSRPPSAPRTTGRFLGGSAIGGTLSGGGALNSGFVKGAFAPAAPAAQPVVAVLSPCAVPFKGACASPAAATPAAAALQFAAGSLLAALSSPDASAIAVKMPAMDALPGGAPRPSPRLLRAGRSPLTLANSSSRLSTVFDWEP